MPNKKTVVKTNSTPDSIKVVDLKVLTFQELWEAYPDIEDPFVDPQTGKKPAWADNQCAIRLSITMHNVGIEMKSFRGEGQFRMAGMRTALRAREMADWLKLRPFGGLPLPATVTGADWQDRIKGRTGIIYFSGYWARDTDSHGQTTGDHIDLWNKNTLTSPGIGGRIDSFLRFRAGLSRAWYSDLAKSKQILFWEIK